jgi:hypothetical protein
MAHRMLTQAVLQSTGFYGIPGLPLDRGILLVSGADLSRPVS